MDPDLTKSLELYRQKIKEYQKFIDESKNEDRSVSPVTYGAVNLSVESDGGSVMVDTLPTSRRHTGTPPLGSTSGEQPLMERFSEILEEKSHQSNYLSTLYHVRDASRTRVETADDFIRQQLQEAGRYYSNSPPSAVYDRQVAWQNHRDYQVEAYRKEKERETRESCSFRPRTTTQSRSPPTRQRPPLVEDPAVALHKERLAAARRLKKEAERRVNGPDVRKWKNEITVPQEFHLSSSPRRRAEVSPRVTPSPRKKTPTPAAVKRSSRSEEEILDQLLQTVVEPLRQKIQQRDAIILKQREMIAELQRQLKSQRGQPVHVDFSREL